MKTLNQHIIGCFLILAFATMGISPACHFVNGTMQIEICKADGSVETIEVETGETAPADHSSHAQHDCMFCFAFTTAKADTTSAFTLIAAVPAHYLSNAGGLIIPQGLSAKAFLATGPPSLIA